MNEEKVITEFGDALKNAMANKTNDLNQYVWKGKDGKEIRLLDMSSDELQKVYNHTTDMLYNTNKYTPGKLQVKKNIRTLISHCNAELLKRYIIHECNVDILKSPIEIIQFIRDSKKANNLTDTDSVTTLFNHLPKEFESITLDLLLSSCLDQLDIINRKMISDNFILSQGIWLTDSEKVDLTEYDSNGQIRPWMEVIKERLILPNIKLRVDPKGFSYSEFRSLIHLSPLPKISSLPTDTLRLLRDKVFILLDADTDYHIAKWEEIKSNIEKVAEYKKITLVKKNYE